MKLRSALFWSTLLAFFLLLPGNVMSQEEEPLPIPQTKTEYPLEQPSGLPTILLLGLEAYKTEGLAAATKIWFDSASPSNERVKAQIDEYFGKVEQAYGKFEGSYLIHLQNYQNTRILYHVMEFEYGPVFMSTVFKKREDEWIIPVMRSALEAESIFPDFLLNRK